MRIKILVRQTSSMMCEAITHYVTNVCLLGMHAYIRMIHETSPNDFCIF